MAFKAIVCFFLIAVVISERDRQVTDSKTDFSPGDGHQIRTRLPLSAIQKIGEARLIRGRRHAAVEESTWRIARIGRQSLAPTTIGTPVRTTTPSICFWSEWSAWSGCSCRMGLRYRNRVPLNSTNCVANYACSRELEPCHGASCSSEPLNSTGASSSETELLLNVDGNYSETANASNTSDTPGDNNNDTRTRLLASSTIGQFNTYDGMESVSPGEELTLGRGQASVSSGEKLSDMYMRGSKRRKNKILIPISEFIETITNTTTGTFDNASVSRSLQRFHHGGPNPAFAQQVCTDSSEEVVTCTDSSEEGVCTDSSEEVVTCTDSSEESATPCTDSSEQCTDSSEEKPPCTDSSEELVTCTDSSEEIGSTCTDSSEEVTKLCTDSSEEVVTCTDSSEETSTCTDSIEEVSKPCTDSSEQCTDSSEEKPPCTDSDEMVVTCTDSSEEAVTCTDSSEEIVTCTDSSEETGTTCTDSSEESTTSGHDSTTCTDSSEESTTSDSGGGGMSGTTSAGSGDGTTDSSTTSTSSVFSTSTETTSGGNGGGSTGTSGQSTKSGDVTGATSTPDGTTGHSSTTTTSGYGSGTTSGSPSTERTTGGGVSVSTAASTSAAIITSSTGSPTKSTTAVESSSSTSTSPSISQGVSSSSSSIQYSTSTERSSSSSITPSTSQSTSATLESTRSVSTGSTPGATEEETTCEEPITEASTTTSSTASSPGPRPTEEITTCEESLTDEPTTKTTTRTATSSSPLTTTTSMICVWHHWSVWSSCDCRSGYRHRKRSPRIVRGCVISGCSRDVQPCKKFPCEVDCVYSQWAVWSKCEGGCDGQGTRRRFRHVRLPGLYGGKKCHNSDLRDWESCKIKNCDECDVGNWAAWTECRPNMPIASSCKCTSMVHGNREMITVEGHRSRERSVIRRGDLPCPLGSEEEACSFQCCA